MFASTERNLRPAERGVSIAVGVLFALAGLYRSAIAAGLVILGGAFALRGVTGHCPVYRRLGISPADPRAEKAHLDACVDTALDDSFPASDPPAFAGGRG